MNHVSRNNDEFNFSLLDMAFGDSNTRAIIRRYRELVNSHYKDMASTQMDSCKAELRKVQAELEEA